MESEASPARSLDMAVLATPANSNAALEIRNVLREAVPPAAADPNRDETTGRVIEEVNEDDKVEEYPYSSDEESEEEDNVHDTDHYKYPNGVPVGDSDDEKERADPERTDPDMQVERRPWHRFDRDSRGTWEKTYLHLTNFPLKGSWDNTENYQKEKDREMLKYLEDFPLEQWVLPPPEPQQAFANLQERKKWRKLGIRIFGGQPPMPKFAPFQRTGAAPMPPPQTGPPQQMGPTQYPAGQGGHMYQRGYQQPPQQPQPQYAMQPQMYSPSPYAQQPGYPPPQQQQLMGPPQSNYAMRPPMQGSMQPPHQSYAQTQRHNVYHSQMQAMPAQLIHGMANGRPGSAGKGKEPGYSLPPTQSRIRIPPYEVRKKPPHLVVAAPKIGRRQNRQPAQCQEFPWNRQFDFPAARQNPAWDMSGYDRNIMDRMHHTREKNKNYLEGEKKRKKEEEKNELASSPPQNARHSSSAGSGSEDCERPKTGRPQGSKSASGRTEMYEFATDLDQVRAAALIKASNPTPDDVFDAYDNKRIPLDATADILIQWNPHKPGPSQELENATFRIKDHLMTSEQFDRTPILTRGAAECLIDFCPSMVWREILLRIVAESGLTNKDIYTRMTHNGNHFDNSTITKRIGSALGIKQQQSGTRAPKRKSEGEGESSTKVKGYAEGEDEYYNNNTKDHQDYMAYFGLNISHRATLAIDRGEKRKAQQLSSDDVEEQQQGGSRRKRAKTSEEVTSPETVGSSVGTPVAEAEEKAEEAGEEDDGSKMDVEEDAVSEQSDTALDEIED